MMSNYYFWGMHWIWWILWVILLVWIFATPYDIPGQRTNKETPTEILKRRLARGEITKEEYRQLKYEIEK